MRILSILTYYHPHWTGLTVLARRIAEGLARCGHTVTVVAVRHDRALPAEESIGGVRVIRLQPLMFVSRGALVPSFPFRVRTLIGGHDLVQIHTPLAESLVVAGLCRLKRRPMVMMHYGDLVMPAGLRNRAVGRTVTSMMAAAARLARCITILSADYAEHSAFLRPFAAKIRAISPPIDLPCPQPSTVAEWRARLGLADRRIVGFAGRFVEEKGFDHLLRALPALITREPQVHLVFAGEHRVAYERFYEQCRDLIGRHRDRVTFVGLLRDPQQLANFYAMCDVFALPSRTDCFAAVQVEAMLSGTPVVASDIPGAREVVRRTGMGLLTRAEEPETFAAALVEVVRDRGRFVQPRGSIRAVYDPDRALCEYNSLMCSLQRT
jgi:glycosyltransferase involved in cell wall biosynthesis